MTAVFVSYSHDSAEHSHRVLQFVEALRGHGIEATIDADVVRPAHGWPHWCEEQLRPEKSDFVLLICTPVYCDRVENKVAFDVGRGAFWEGSIIYDYVYEEKGNQRFIPLLLDGATKTCIPRPIRNHTHYAIEHYDFTDRGYRKLYRELTKQNPKRKPTGEVVELDATYPGAAVSRLRAGPSPLVAHDAEPAKSHENVAERLRRKRWTFLTLLALLFIAIVVFLLPSWRRPRPPAAVAPVRTLAVLPFKPLVVSKRDEALEMGMAETLIAKIGTIDGVTVCPLSAVRRYRGVEQDPRLAGRALKVDAVLDGSIQENGKQIRVIVRLLRVEDGRQLWSRTYDILSSTIISLHDRISSAVLDELSVELTEDQQTRLHRRDTQDPEAYRQYLLGRHYSDRADPDRYQTAIKYFQRAIALDPGYALAYAGLADVHATLPICCDHPSEPSSVAANDAANKAISIDPRLAAAHVTLGWQKFFLEWDWLRAEDEFRHALQLDPSNADAHRMYAHLLSNTGRHNEALRQVEAALHIDPLSLMNNTMRAQFLLQANRIDAAIAADKEALEINPGFWLAHMLLGNAFVRKAMYVEALAEYRVSYDPSTGATEPRARTAHLLAITGREQEAREILLELTAMSKRRYVPHYNLAMIHAGLGERAEAVHELRRACTERDVRLVFIGVEPLWNVLHDEPGWAEVERCVNLPPVVELRINPLTDRLPTASGKSLARAFAAGAR
jgi:TolB-like protein/Flp pilus assembly protein TadD